MYQSAGSTSQTSPVANSLIRAGTPITRKVTLLAGSVYVSGSVLGTITASKKATLSAAAATDGSQVPDFVLP